MDAVRTLCQTCSWNTTSFWAYVHARVARVQCVVFALNCFATGCALNRTPSLAPACTSLSSQCRGISDLREPLANVVGVAGILVEN
jgi:hypothetical protein